MRKIDNLVFKGGGVLGIAYAGAITALSDNGLLDKITGSAGTSAGALLSLMVALNYKDYEVKKIAWHTDFKKFKDDPSLLAIESHYGYYKGHTLYNFIGSLVKHKTNHTYTTYGELKDLGFKDLKVFATDLNTKSIKEFSAAKTPNVSIAQSVRASMSIPLFFRAWQFIENKPNNHIYVDGGLIHNYPITAFSPKNGDDPLENTLGFYLYDKDKKVTNDDLSFYHLFKYIEISFQTLLSAQNTAFFTNKEEVNASVLIDDFGISATNFDLNDKQKEELYNSGKQATLKYIEKHKLVDYPIVDSKETFPPK